MSDVLTTIVVKFEGNAADNVDIIYEPDPKRNVDSAGEEKTSFTENDVFYFLININGPGQISAVKSSSGSIFKVGEENQTRHAVLDFVEVNSEEYNPSVSYKPDGGIGIQWIGRNQGLNLTIQPDSLKANITGGTTPCKAYLSYPVHFHVYKLVPPKPITIPSGFDSFDILIAIHVSST